MTNFDLILDRIKENRPYSSEYGQELDVDLICELVWLKYNSVERLEFSEKLQIKLRRCLAGKESWFTNNY